MDYGALIQAVVAYMGEENARKLSQQQLDLVARQYANIMGIKVPDLPPVQAENLGPSAVSQLTSDEGLRGRQMQTLSEMQNAIDRGGLDLTDRAALEEANSAAFNQQRRARAGVASDAAARGQMNSGNRLLMDMDAAQQGANNARQQGLQVAGMAQRRRQQLMEDQARMAGGLREQDWREKEASARAKDIRDERNAAAREKAQYYNAGLPQQNFTNQMARATGSQPAANAYGGALGAAATDARASAAGIGAIANHAVNGAYGGVTRNGATGGSSSGSYTYLVNSDDPNDVYAHAANYGGSDPWEWENPY